MVTNKQYSDAQNTLSLISNKRQLLASFIAKLTDGDNMNARDYDIGLKGILESWDDMNYDTMNEANTVVLSFKRQEAIEYEREHSTHYGLPA